MRLVGIVIRQEEIIPMLLDACPGFRPVWEEHVTCRHGGSAGLYNDLTEFVFYLIEAYEKGQTSVLTAAFNVLERLLVDGDSSVRENAASHESYTAKVFIPYLKPESLREWNAIDQGWEDLMRRNHPS